MLRLKFTDGLVTVVVQDARTRAVLMVAYANDEAVRVTRETGFAHYYSRRRKKLWKKGEESGHFQKVRRILVDCDEDCVLYEVEQTGAACHTGHPSCFYRTIEGDVISKPVFDPAEVYGKNKKKLGNCVRSAPNLW
jgi:phosphoribosyl-AMP cyclohydrolase